MKIVAPATILAALLVSAAHAGVSSSKEIVAPPPIEPSLWEWFIGGSAGYLFDFEEPMYHAQAGVHTPWNWGGWRTSLFLEAGFTNSDEWGRVPDLSIVGAVVWAPVKTKLDVVPLTFNLQLDRPLSERLHFYLGAGLGVGFTDFKATGFFFGGTVHRSQSDTVFYGQAFAGLSYKATRMLDIYAGLRYIYADFSAPAWAPATSVVKFGKSDGLAELGLRLNF